MSNIKLLILDDDFDYANNLSTFLSHYYSQVFIVCQLNNNITDLGLYIKKSEADIILTSEYYYKKIDSALHKIIVILSTGVDSIECKDCHSIFKYMDAIR